MDPNKKTDFFFFFAKTASETPFDPDFPLGPDPLDPDLPQANIEPPKEEDQFTLEDQLDEATMEQIQRDMEIAKGSSSSINPFSVPKSFFTDSFSRIPGSEFIPKIKTTEKTSSRRFTRPLTSPEQPVKDVPKSSLKRTASTTSITKAAPFSWKKLKIFKKAKKDHDHSRKKDKSKKKSHSPE